MYYVSFTGFEDLSPEEVRLKAYEAEASGTGPHYVRKITCFFVSPVSMLRGTK